MNSKMLEKWMNNRAYYKSQYMSSDDNELFAIVKDFIIESLKKHISLGLDTDEVFILGKKNADFIKKLNNRVCKNK